jgi:hypothetical protein
MSMMAVYVAFWSLVAAEDFHGKLVFQEGEERASYRLDLKPGLLRIEPEEADVYLLLDVDSRTMTLVDEGERFYSRLRGEDFQRLLKSGEVSLSWFPWVYRASSDLLENLEIETKEGARLPDGTSGVHIEVFSTTYERVVAEYWLDPSSSPALFFQWRTVYLEFWGEGDAEADQAQKDRLELYENMPGFPVRMEERFALLTRPRALELENLGPIPEDAFEVPADFVEKAGNELLWESLLKRLERWFRPKP